MNRKRWTDSDDRFLLAYGPIVGFAYVAYHDLGRPFSAGPRRFRWLKKHKPDLVAEISTAEARADAEKGGQSNA